MANKDIDFNDDFLFNDSNFLDSPDIRDGKVSSAKRFYRTNKTILKSIGRGLVSGLKNGLSDSFPNTTSLIEEVVSIKDDVTSLKDEIVSEITPSIASLNGIGAKVLPKVENFIPKKVYEKVNTYLNEHKADKEISESQRKKQEQDSIISAAISGAFSTKMEQDLATAKENKKDTQVDRLIAGARFKELGKLMGGLDSRLEAVNAYMNTPMTNYFKAALELKYKHLFVAKDTFDITRSTSKSMLARLEEIKHNVGLPDSIKEETLKNKNKKFLDSFGDRATNLKNAFFKNLREKTLTKLKEFTSMVPLLESVTDMMDMMGNEKLTKADVIGFVLGKITSGITKNLVSRKFDSGLMGHMKTLAENRLELGKERIGGNILRRAKDWSISGDAGKELIGSSLRDGMQSMTNTSIKNDLFDNTDKATAFDTMTKTAIISVIPRHLEYIGSHVSRLAQKIAGDIQPSEKRYDPTTGQLADSPIVLKNLMGAAKSSAGFSGYTRAQTIDSFRAVYAHTKNKKIDNERIKKLFDTNKDDLNKFITNIAINLEGEWNPEAIYEYAVNDGGVTPYIEKAFEGIKEPYKLAKLLANSVYDKNGKKNIVSNNAIEIAIVEEVKNMNPAKIAEFISKHSFRDLAVKSKLYNTSTNKISTAALHQIYKPINPLASEGKYNLSIGNVNKGPVEDTQEEFNYTKYKLEKHQEAQDAVRVELDKLIAEGKGTGRKAYALKVLLGDIEPGDIVDSISEKVVKVKDSVVEKFKTKEKNIKDFVDKGLIRIIAPKATLIKIKRLSSNTSELTLLVPVKRGEGYLEREQTIQLKHEAISTEEVPKAAIVKAMSSSAKTNILHTRYYSKESDKNYFPIKYDFNTIEILTKPDTSFKYEDFSFNDTTPKQTTESYTTPKKDFRKKKKLIIPSSNTSDIKVSPMAVSKLTESLNNIGDNVANRFLDPLDNSDVWFKDSIVTIDKNIAALVPKQNTNIKPNIGSSDSADTYNELVSFHSDFLNASSIQLGLLRDMVGYYTNSVLDPVRSFIKRSGTWMKTKKDRIKTSAGSIWKNTMSTGGLAVDWFMKTGKSIKGFFFKDKDFDPNKKTWRERIGEGFDSAKHYTAQGLKYAGKGISTVGTGVASGVSKAYTSIRDFGKNHPSLSKGTKDFTKSILQSIGGNTDILIGTAIGGMLGGVPGAALGAAGGAAASAAWGKTKALVKGGWKKLFTKYVDVYERGKPIIPGKPILSAQKQKEGVFFADGRKLKKSKAITEPVFGLNNEGYVDSKNALITQEQIDAGLVDVDGNLLTKHKGEDEEATAKPPRMKGGGAILESLGYIYKGIWGLMFGVAKGAGKATKTLLGRLFGIEGSEIKEYHSKSLEYLSKITTILDESAVLARKKVQHDKDGDGDREGSWEDQLEKNAEDSLTIETPGVKPKENILKNAKDKVKGAIGNSFTNIATSIRSILGVLTSIATPLLAALPYVAITGAAVGGAYLGNKGSKEFFKAYSNDNKIREKFNLDEDEKIKFSHRLKTGYSAFGEATYLNKVPVFKKLFEINDRVSNEQPLSETEIETFRTRMRSYIASGDASAKDKLEKFERAISKQNWRYARKVAGIEEGVDGSITSGVDVSNTKHMTRTGAEVSKLEDDSDLGKRLTLMLDTINKSIKESGALSIRKKYKLKTLKEKLLDLHEKELTKGVLDAFSMELTKIDSEADPTSEYSVAQRDIQEKEKEELIKRRYRLLDSIIISQQRTKDNLKKQLLGNLKGKVESITLEELDSDILDKYDKDLVFIDKNAIASSSTYMDTENDDKREKKLESLRKKIQKSIEKVPGQFGMRRLMELRTKAAVAGDTVDDEYITGIENTYNTTLEAMSQYYKSPDGQAELSNKKKSDGTTDETIPTTPVKQAEAKAAEAVNTVETDTHRVNPNKKLAAIEAQIKAKYGIDVEIDFDDPDEIQDAWREAELKYKAKQSKEAKQALKTTPVKQSEAKAAEAAPDAFDVKSETNSTSAKIIANVLLPIKGESKTQYEIRLHQLREKKPGLESYYNNDNDKKVKAVNDASIAMGNAGTDLNFEEKAFSFDKAGLLKDVSKGSRNRVNIKGYKSGNVLHTHPGGNGLSDTDIKSAMKGGLQNIFAITPDGDIQRFNTDTKEITTTYNDIKQRKLTQSNNQQDFNSAALEDGLYNIHTAESTQVKQLNIVIETLKEMISAIVESKAIVNKNVADASLAAFEAAVSVSDSKLAATRKPKPSGNIAKPSELNLNKPRLI